LKKSVLHRIFAIVLLLVLVVPNVIEIAHDSCDHEHTSCTATDTKHIHQQDLDCCTDHSTLDNNALLLNYATNYLQKQTYFECFNATPLINSLGFLELEPSRGPPHIS